jgi:hypothetical protein
VSASTTLPASAVAAATSLVATTLVATALAATTTLVATTLAATTFVAAPTFVFGCRVNLNNRDVRGAEVQGHECRQCKCQNRLIHGFLPLSSSNCENGMAAKFRTTVTSTKALDIA